MSTPGWPEVPDASAGQRGIEHVGQSDLRPGGSGDLKGIQIGGRNQRRVERAKLEEYIAEAYQRTAQQLDQLPAESPADT